MSVESGPQFLKEEYDLHNKPEVEAAVKRSERQTGERVPIDPTVRIQKYLDRLENVFNPPELEGHEDFDRAERNLSLIKHALHRNFVIKPDQIPESYWETQQRLAREQGHGDIEVTPEARAQGTEVIIADQESSLDNWVDYLSSDDATYPLWLKYFAVRGILGMSTYDKEKHQFSKRDKGTTAPFPDLDREALAYVLDAVEKRQEPEYHQLTNQIRQAKNELKRLRGEFRQQQKQNVDTATLSDQLVEKESDLRTLELEQANLVSGHLNIPDESRQELRGLLHDADFAKLYAWALEKVTPAEENELLTTEGEWIKYDQGSDHLTLVQSLQGHGTGWCTAGESTARTQLDGGDFYVFYSNDKHGQPTIPRAAIRMQGDSIAEVRGIAAEQNLDPYIAPVVQTKMTEFPDGAAYEKKSQDMQRLTQVERKAKAGRSLNKDDLIFLYEINGTIEGFGYQRDPRIAELREQRDPLADAPIVFECTPEQIAHGTSDITPDTKAYIGKLEPGIFDLIQQNRVEHVFTSFPEGKIERSELTIGGQTVEQLEEQLRVQDIKISSYAEDMLHSPDFTTLPEPEQIQLVRLRVDALLDGSPTTDQLYARAAELGLELCPAEVGPYQRLQDTDQPLGEWYRIAMKQIAVRSGNPLVFALGSHDDGLWLLDYWAKLTDEWHPGYQFLFRLRKQSLET